MKNILVLLLLGTVAFAAAAEEEFFGPPRPDLDPVPVESVPAETSSPLRIVTLAPGGPLLRSPILSRLGYYRAVREIAGNRWGEARRHLVKTVEGDPSLVRAHLLLSIVQLRELDPRWILSLFNSVRALKGNFRAQSLLVANLVIYALLLYFLLLLAIASVAVLRHLPALRHAISESAPRRVPHSIRLLYPVVVITAVVLVFRPWGWTVGMIWLVAAGLFLTWKALARWEKTVALALFFTICMTPALLRFAVHISLPATPGTTLFALAGTSLAPLGDERASTLLVGGEGDRDILFSLALLERERGNSEEAIRLYRELLAGGHESPAVYNNMGNLLFLKGEVDYAFNAYRRALSLDPARATSHYNLGQLYLEVFSFDQARQAFSRASEIDFSLIRNLSHAEGESAVHTLVDDSIPATRLWGRFLAGRSGGDGISWDEALHSARRIFFPFETARALPLLAALGIAFWYGQTRPSPRTCVRCGRSICRNCRVRSGGLDWCSDCSGKSRFREWNRWSVIYHRPMAISLSLILPGSGHIYLGRRFLGAAYASLAILLLLVWSFRGPILKPFPVIHAADLAPLENLLFGWLFVPFYAFVFIDALLIARRVYRVESDDRRR